MLPVLVVVGDNNITNNTNTKNNGEDYRCLGEISRYVACNDAVERAIRAIKE